MFWKQLLKRYKQGYAVIPFERAALLAQAEYEVQCADTELDKLRVELAAKENIIATLHEEAAENTAHFAERAEELEAENAWLRAQQKKPTGAANTDEPKDG